MENIADFVANKKIEISIFTDTIFIPVLFKKPFELDESYVASLKIAEIALETFAQILKFNLNSSFDEEISNNI